MTQYYPLPPSGAFTGYMPGANPYVPGGGYSTGVPAGYGLPLPPKFESAPNASWMTPPAEQFERRHLSSNVDASPQAWVLGLTLAGTSALVLMALSAGALGKLLPKKQKVSLGTKVANFFKRTPKTP